MTETPDKLKAAEDNAVETPVPEDAKVKYRSSAMAWVTILLTVSAWVVLMWWNGYAAVAVGAAAIVIGFLSLPGRSAATKNLAITGIIASAVLVVVILAFIIVLKIGLGG